MDSIHLAVIKLLIYLRTDCLTSKTTFSFTALDITNDLLFKNIYEVIKMLFDAIIDL
jgi:hypothetical protein